MHRHAIRMVKQECHLQYFRAVRQSDWLDDTLEDDCSCMYV